MCGYRVIVYYQIMKTLGITAKEIVHGMLVTF